MIRNYLLVYQNKTLDSIEHQYFETLEDMHDFIRVNLRAKKHWKVLHKYKIEEL